MTSEEILAAALAEEIALLARETTPDPAYGFGCDLSCLDELTDEEIPGSDPRIVTEAIYRMVTTPFGSLPDDRNYGVDIRALLSRPNPDIAGILRGTILKDDRVQACSVTVTGSGTTRYVDISGETAGEPFTLTFDTATLLERGW